MDPRQPTRPTPTAPARGGEPGSAQAMAEVRMLRALLLVGCVAMAAIWGLEFRAGLLTPWSTPLYLVLGAVLAGCALSLFLRPQQSTWPRLLACGAVNAYLVLTLHLTLWHSATTPDAYALASAMVWLPLGYAAAFLFLQPRAALGVSLLSLLSGTVPLAVYLLRGQPTGWPSGFETLALNVAVAQLIYLLLLLAIASLRRGYHRLQAIADTDPLTGLSNRRALDVAMAAHAALAQRGKQTLSVLLIDVDHFKQINDQHGHAVGDAVLVQIADILQSQVRASDRVGRWGGEEFLLLAPATPLQAATELAERIRIAVAETSFAHGVPVTLSLGLTQMRPGDDVALMVQRADRALYRAKQRGRNRVEVQALAMVS